VVTGDAGRPVLQTPGGWSIPLPAGWPLDSGRAVTLGVRPERIIAPHAGPDSVPLGDWAVTRAEPRGPAWLLTVARPGLCWRAWWPAQPAAVTLPLAVPAGAVFLFDAVTGGRIEAASGASN